MSDKNINSLLNEILIRKDFDACINYNTKVENRVKFLIDFQTWINSVPEFKHSGALNKDYLFVNNKRECLIDILNEPKTEIDNREAEFIVVSNHYKYSEIEYLEKFTKDKFDKIPSIEILRLLFIREVIKGTTLLNPKFGFKSITYKAYIINEDKTYKVFSLDDNNKQIEKLTKCFDSYVSI